MRLSDIMSAMRLSSYAEIGLLLFLAAFVAIAIYVFRTGESEDWHMARRLPLDPMPEDPMPRGSMRGGPVPDDAASAKPYSGAESTMRGSQ